MRMVAGVLILAAGCTPSGTSQDEYSKLISCEVVTFVVSKFHPSMSHVEREQLKSAKGVISRRVVTAASEIGKTSGDIELDQRKQLEGLQNRTSGPEAEREANKMIDEAKACAESANT